MKRTDYSKPTMKVFTLKHRQLLAAASGVESSRQNYGSATEETWE